MKKKSSKKNLVLIALLCVVSVIFLLYNQVDKEITESDKIFIGHIMSENQLSPISSGATYEDEIDFIKGVQKAVLRTAPEDEGLPEGTPREPETLYKAHKGLCYDRSRVIEKILRLNGFETRHIAVYSLREHPNALKAILSKGTKSHALSEVKTKRGWIFVDSNAKFIGLDQQNNPLDMETLRDSDFYKISWNDYNDKSYQVIYRDPFTFVYGLYSRHGYFYPPYNKIPDINWREFAANI